MSGKSPGIQRASDYTAQPDMGTAGDRLAAMGGQPVLGGAFMLPEGELLQRRQNLASTSSPAAREMAKLRATSLDSRAAPGPSCMQIPPWLVRNMSPAMHCERHCETAVWMDTRTGHTKTRTLPVQDAIFKVLELFQMHQGLLHRIRLVKSFPSPVSKLSYCAYFRK